jgi:hypothetical protein
VEFYAGPGYTATRISDDVASEAYAPGCWLTHLCYPPTCVHCLAGMLCALNFLQ